MRAVSEQQATALGIAPGCAIPSRERSTAQANLFIGGTYVRERVKRLRIPGPALGVSAAPRSELTR